MSTTAARPDTVRVVDRIGVLAVVIGMVLGLLPTIAGAADGNGPLAPGDFEIDGDVGGAHDWAGLGGEQPEDEIETGNLEDATWFEPSTRESDYGDPGWGFVDKGNVPKGDLHRLYAKTQIAPGASFIWLGASVVGDSGNVSIVAEFNRDKPPSEPTGRYRADGDLYVTFNFGGGGPQVAIAQWPGPQAPNGSYGAAAPLVEGVHFRSAVSGSQDFVEIELNLEAIFGDGDLGLECGSFGGLMFRSEVSSGTGTTGGGTTGGNDNSILKDITAPIAVDLDLCSDVSVEKVDESGSPLAGAAFTLYSGATADAGAVVTADGVDNPCVTDASGACSFGTVQPGTYTIDETSVPVGYRVDPALPDTFEVGENVLGGVTRIYEDPRIPYTIDVSPEAPENSVDRPSHVFTVTVCDEGAALEGANDDGDEDCTGADDAPLDLTLTDSAGGYLYDAIALAWTGAGAVGAVTDVDGDGAQSSCRPADGTCQVTVSSTDPGSGTLVATWDTPYQNTVAPDPASTTTGPVADAYITDAGTKVWIGYRAEIAAQGLNLVGQPHLFTATVYEVDGTPPDDVASGVIVTFDWAPGTAQGSGLTTTTCTTDLDGTCTVVASDGGFPGTGTISITTVDGVVGDEEALSVDFTVGDVSTTKTWREYRATLDSDSVNPSGEDHTFTAAIEYRDDEALDWEPAPDGTVVSSYDWTGAGAVVAADSTCLGAGTTGGDCSFVVTSPSPGSGTLDVLGVEGALLGDAGATDETVVVADAATKTWLDFEVDVTPDGDNLVGEDHVFTIDVEQFDGSGYGPIEDGSTVTFSLSDGGASYVDDTCSSTLAGQCTVTVTSVTPGSVTLTGLGITGYGGFDEPADIAFDASNDTDGVTDEAEKTWYDHRAFIEADALNLVGDPHTFTVTAQVDDGTGWTAVDDGTVVTVSSAGLTSALVDQSDCADGTIGGTCDVIVDADDPGTVTVTVATVGNESAVDSAVTAVDVSAGDALDEGQSATADKTWVAFRSDIGDDAVNLTGDPHDFTVLTEYTVDGSTWLPVPDGSAVTYSDDEAVGPPATDTCSSTGTADGDGTGECTITVASDTSGTRTITVTGVTATITADGSTDTFTVAFAADEPGVGTFAAADYTATKTWASYALDLTPDSAVNLLPVDPDHTYRARLISDDATNAPVGGQSIDVTISGDVGTIASVESGAVADDGLTATCITTADGTCDLVVTSTVPGDAQLDASFDAIIGASAAFTVEAVPASKTWTTYRVTVTPEEAVNLVGNVHTFTATVETSSRGGVWVPVEDARPRIVVTGIDLTIDSSDCDDGTASDGTCTAEVTSDTVQAVTLTATYDAAVGQSTAAFSDSGDKDWIDHAIDVTPDTDENLVDNDHVFTVTVTTTYPVADGLQTDPVVGAAPTVMLTGVGSITDSTCDEGTDASGQCAVTITSSATGDSKVTATYLGTAADDTEQRAYTDTGTKLWVDYLLMLSEDAVNAVGDEHTFTATLTLDTGQGFDPAAGETLAFTVGGVGSVTGGDVDGDLVCTTDAAGECDLLVNSDEAGATTVDVSFDAVVGATSRTDADTAVKQWVDIELVKTAVVGDGPADGDLLADPDGGFPFLAFSSSDQGPKSAVFEYLVTNPSKVTLEDVVLVDDRLGTIIGAADGVTLAPGASTTVRSQPEAYTYSDAIATFGAPVTNVAIVTATAGGEDVSATDTATIGFVAVQSSILIDLAKEVVDGAGDVTVVDGRPTVTWSRDEYEAGVAKRVTYRFTATNISNATIIDVELVDPMLSDQPLIATSDGVTLAPDESAVFEVDHLLTVDEAFPDDPIATRIDNVATVRGNNESRDSFSQDVDDASLFVEIVFDESLPATGLHSITLLPLGLLLVALGCGVLWLSRRRTTVW